MIKKHVRPINGHAIQNKIAMIAMPIYLKHGIKIGLLCFFRIRKSVAPWDIPMKMIRVRSVSSGMLSGVACICMHKKRQVIQNKKASLCNMFFLSAMSFCLLIIGFLARGGL